MASAQQKLLDEVEAVAAVVAYSDNAADEPIYLPLTVSNMDNMGRTRRQAVVNLVHALGGGTDTYSIRNTSGCGIYSFAIDAYVPRVIAGYLRSIVAGMLAEADKTVAESARGNRARMRTEGVSARAVKAGDAVYRRGLLELRLAQYALTAHAVLDGTQIDRSTLPDAARQARAARKARAQVAA